MSNRKNHRRGEAARTENGPRYESKNPGAGSNSTHVAQSRKKWKRRGARSERRTGKTSPKVRLSRKRADEALGILRAARERREPITLSTSRGVFEDCAIQEISAPVVDPAGGVSVTIRFEPITVKAAAATAGQHAPDLSPAAAEVVAAGNPVAKVADVLDPLRAKFDRRAVQAGATRDARRAAVAENVFFHREIDVDPEATKRAHEQPFPPLRPRGAAERIAPLSDFPGAQEWLATGERGASSETILSCITGIKIAQVITFPLDPADLRRCRLLLEAAPTLRAHLRKVAALGKEWAAIVDAWDELCALMDAETPHWREGHGDALKVYNRMRELWGER